MYNFLFKISYVRYWNPKWKGLDVGHRGSGTSFKATSGGSIRENTIASLKKAGESGAEFVEFDVSLVHSSARKKGNNILLFSGSIVEGLTSSKKRITFRKVQFVDIVSITIGNLSRLSCICVSQEKSNS